MYLRLVLLSTNEFAQGITHTKLKFSRFRLTVCRTVDSSYQSKGRGNLRKRNATFVKPTFQKNVISITFYILHPLQYFQIHTFFITSITFISFHYISFQMRRNRRNNHIIDKINIRENRTVNI